MQPFHTDIVSTNAGIPRGPIGVVQKSSEERHRSGNTRWNQITYPDSGAFQHLPVRRTLSGSPAQEHPNARTIFLRDLPAHCYILPSVPLNFTIVEIIVLLPNWVKNKAVAARFLNNNLTAAVHFMILEEHRHLQFSNEKEKERAKKTITDEYRRTMRKIFPTWTKAGHTVPFGWDPSSLVMDGFVPDDVQMPGYRRTASIPFRDLATGVKKVPEGTNAGDLTHALQFALQRPEVYMFPEDLPTILDHIGRIKITTAHTDRLVVRRYDETRRKEDLAKKYPPRQDGHRPTAEEIVARLPHHEPFEREKVHTMMQSLHQGGRPAPVKQSESYGRPFQVHQDGFNVADMQPQQERTTWSLNQGPVVHSQTQLNSMYEMDELFRLPAQVGEDVVDYQAADQSLYVGVEHSSEAMMDALLQLHQDTHDSRMTTPPASPPYAPRHLLRECIEGNIGFDGSAFAQAARYAQRPDQIGTDWYVENVPWLVQMRSSAQPKGAGFDFTAG